jgi:hypothetical protein
MELIHKSTKIIDGDVIMKEYLHKDCNKKIVFQVMKPETLKKSKNRLKFKYLPAKTGKFFSNSRGQRFAKVLRNINTSFGISNGGNEPQKIQKPKEQPQKVIFREKFHHAKKGITLKGLVWYSDNPKFKIFDDTDDYYPIQFSIMFNRLKFGENIKHYKLNESEALLYRL